MAEKRKVKRLKGSPKVTSRLADAAASGFFGKSKSKGGQTKAVKASKRTGSGGVGQAASKLRSQAAANRRALLGD